MTDELDVNVVLGDLSRDAQKWRDIADAMDGARRTAHAVQHIPDFVTDGLSYAMGFQQQYNSLGDQSVGYVAEGVAAMRAIAERLDATRREYEDSEEFALSETSAAERA